MLGTTHYLNLVMLFHLMTCSVKPSTLLGSAVALKRLLWMQEVGGVGIMGCNSSNVLQSRIVLYLCLLRRPVSLYTFHCVFRLLFVNHYQRYFGVHLGRACVILNAWLRKLKNSLGKRNRRDVP